MLATMPASYVNAFFGFMLAVAWTSQRCRLSRPLPIPAHSFEQWARTHTDALQ